MWIGALAISTGAYAQTQNSIESEIIDLSSKAFTAYISVDELSSKSSFTTSECNTARANLFTVGDETRAFLDRTKPFFEESRSLMSLDLRSSAGKVFSAIVSTLTAANILCSGGNKDIAKLNLEAASLKFDISNLYRSKAVR